MLQEPGLATIGKTTGMPEVMPGRTPPPDLLETLEPLSTLSRARREELAAFCRLESVPAGSAVLREGERDGETVYLLHGIVSLHTARPGRLRQLRAGETRHPLADRQPRPVTVVAETACEVLRIENDVLETALAWNALASHATETGRAWMDILKQALVFRPLPPAHLAQLGARMQRLAVTAGQTLIREGDEGDYYYIIESGTVDVERRDLDGLTRTVAVLGPGQAFGEEALVSGAHRNATVIMKTAGVLQRLAKADFDELLRAPLLKQLTYAEAAARVACGAARWLDVRHEIEYRHVHVPGALSCPLHELRRHTESLDPHPEYICYCRTGRRSSAAAFLLAQRGFRAAVLQNGFEALPAYESY
jgi:CRP-like cAMP-binding protein